MANQHPITPPPELVQQWMYVNDVQIAPLHLAQALATQAARWGADQELKACCEWFVRDWTDIETADNLRAARRPKPPSLKEQALKALDSFEGFTGSLEELGIIRRALEQLND